MHIRYLFSKKPSGPTFSEDTDGSTKQWAPPWGGGLSGSSFHTFRHPLIKGLSPLPSLRSSPFLGALWTAVSLQRAPAISYNRKQEVKYCPPPTPLQPCIYPSVRWPTRTADLSLEPWSGCPGYPPAFLAGDIEEKAQCQGKTARESALTTLWVDSLLSALGAKSSAAGRKNQVALAVHWFSSDLWPCTLACKAQRLAFFIYSCFSVCLYNINKPIAARGARQGRHGARSGDVVSKPLTIEQWQDADVLDHQAQWT